MYCSKQREVIYPAILGEVKVSHNQLDDGFKALKRANEDGAVCLGQIRLRILAVCRRLTQGHLQNVSL